MLEAVVLSAAPLKGVLAAVVETGVETTEADGATTTEAVPTGAVATGTRVVLLAVGYGATGTTLLSGTTEAAGAVLRMTAGVEAFATTAGTDETIGVTIGATGVEETATGVALLAVTEWVRVQGHSVIVKVVACMGEILSANAHRWMYLQPCEEFRCLPR